MINYLLSFIISNKSSQYCSMSIHLLIRIQEHSKTKTNPGISDADRANLDILFYWKNFEIIPDNEINNTIGNKYTDLE